MDWIINQSKQQRNRHQEALKKIYHHLILRLSLSDQKEVVKRIH